MYIVRDFLFMKKIVAVLFSFVAMTICGQQLYVGSYNIRYKNEHDSINGNVWEVRSKVMTDQIAFEQPDIFGTQEMLAGQISDFENSCRSTRISEWHATTASRQANIRLYSTEKNV